MRKQIRLSQTQSGKELLIVRIEGFSFQFGLRVYGIRAVHASGADADHDALIIPEDLPESCLPEEPVLGRDMPSAQDHHIGVTDQYLRVFLVSAVQGDEVFESESGTDETGIRISQIFVHNIPPVGIGTYVDCPAVLRETVPQLIDEAVGRIQNSCVVYIGPAGKKTDHF